MNRKVLLLHLDGKLPNVALMRIAAHHRSLGDSVELRYAPNPRKVERQFWDAPDAVYASAIFEKTRPTAERVREVYPGAIVGGTGVSVTGTLEDIGIATKDQDYSIYPKWRQSIGFTQRGCRLKCSFCVVPRKEPNIVEENTTGTLWRGDPWPRELILLDNDFFGQPSWRRRIEEMRSGRFKVAFSQGINARALNDETAAAVASVDYRDDSMKAKRIYTAWDNRKDEGRLFKGLELLAKHGVKPDHVMVFVLIGYDHATKSARPSLDGDDFHRMERLREFGARPYPMPFVRTRELVGFQRWAQGGNHKKYSWADWVAGGYRPENMHGDADDDTFFGE